jgi:beta-glucosidase
MAIGEAVAGTILGRASPSGRLPISFPRSSGHLRCLYDRPPLRLARYGDSEETPLYAFGHGLGYSPIRYDRVSHPALVRAGEAVELALDVVNEGSLRTDHVVLAFIRDAVSSVTTPERKLCAFLRVRALEPGERRRVSLTVEPEGMALVDATGRRVIEPGSFDLTLDSGVGAISTSFELVEN